ncbi:restriction endonuclease subunit S [Listeria monocytogenes]|nr:restriction endonuclease subunit S [Listeria monocytogenes]
MRNLEKSVPVIRFKGFSEAWEQRKLGEESDVRDGTHDSPKYVNTGHPLVTSKNLKDFGLDFSGVSFISDEDFESINKRSKVDVGDILFGMIGTIGTPVQLIRKDFAIKNVALIKEKKNILNRFLIHLLKSAVFDRYIENENTGGTQKFLSLSKIRNFCFLSPKLEEQDQISLFFKQLDNAIALHQRKLDALKLMKKGLLQQMFPNNEEKVPRLRFADFNEKWERCKISSFARNTYGGGTPKTNVPEYWQGRIPWIQSGDLLIDSLFNIIPKKHVTGSAVKSSATKCIPANSIAIVTRVGVGKLAFIPFEYTTSQDFLSLSNLRVDSNFGTYSIYIMLQRELNNIQGSTIKGITKSDLLEKNINKPLNRIEQERIGVSLKLLDNIITLHQSKLEKLSSLKKVYLQRMFI